MITTQQAKEHLDYLATGPFRAIFQEGTIYLIGQRLLLDNELMKLKELEEYCKDVGLGLSVSWYQSIKAEEYNDYRWMPGVKGE